jgi:alpha-1,2-mannosyltransferase
MYTTMLASSYALHPATNTATGTSRVYKATFLYALGAIVGWPFSAALAIPFVLEQLFCFGGEVVVGQNEVKQWEIVRFARFAKAVALGAAIAVPVYLVDSWAYGRSTFPTLNIVMYNVFSDSGPELYGTEPATFYLSNLFLNFNFLLPLALLSLPGLFITSLVNYRQLGKSQQKPKEGETNPYTLLTLRLLPFYIWLGILTLQPHKEERFFFPAYPLLVLNAAVSVFMIKGWTQAAYIKITASPYRVSILHRACTLADSAGWTFIHVLLLVAGNDPDPYAAVYFARHWPQPLLPRAPGRRPPL